MRAETGCRDARGRAAGGCVPPAAAQKHPRTEGPWPVRAAGSACAAARHGRVPAGALGPAARHLRARQHVPRCPRVSPPGHIPPPTAAEPTAMPGAATRPCGYPVPTSTCGSGCASPTHSPFARRRGAGCVAEPRVLHAAVWARCPVLTTPLSFCHRVPNPSVPRSRDRCPGCPRTPWLWQPGLEEPCRRLPAGCGTVGMVPGRERPGGRVGSRELRRAHG